MKETGETLRAQHTELSDILATVSILPPILPLVA